MEQDYGTATAVHPEIHQGASAKDPVLHSRTTQLDSTQAIKDAITSLWTQPLLSLPAIFQLGRARRQFRKERHRLLQGEASGRIVVYIERIDGPTRRIERSPHKCKALITSHALPEWNGDLVEWCWRDIVENPADCVVLTDHSMPLVIAGLLYKLTWGAMVLVASNNEANTVAKRTIPITINQLKLECQGLPEATDLNTDEWSSLALDCLQRFDGIAHNDAYIRSGEWHGYMNSEVDGAQLNCLESIAPELASPLMAARFWEWNHKRIDWQALAAKKREQRLVSIVIPAYGDSRELEQCLHNLRQTHSIRWEWEAVVVMNDDSEKNSNVALYHSSKDTRIKLVWPGENVQFALGCNLGFAASEGKWIVFLNNDCTARDGWLDGLIDPLVDSAVAATQPRLVRSDGSIQSLGVVFHDGQTIGYPLYSGLPGTESCTLKPHHLHALTGACLAVRATDFAEIQGFDCRYLNSQEDIDLCLRLLQQPRRRFCLSTPTSTVLHAGGRAPGRFSHSKWSRHQFVRRWMQRAPADDTRIYRSDGMRVEGFKSDHVTFNNAGIGAGRARVSSRERQGDQDMG